MSTFEDLVERCAKKLHEGCPHCGGSGIRTGVEHPEHAGMFEEGPCSDYEHARQAAHIVLSEIETPHIVEFTDDGWHLEHSIVCRLAGLARCPIHAQLASRDRPLREPGRYVITLTEHDDGFEVRTVPA